MLAEWDIGALVPGHGSVTNDRDKIRARLEADRAYLAELRGRVENSVREGLSVGETMAACGAMHYRLPDRMAAYHRLNVETAYVEAGGPADPKLCGWNQDWEKE